MIIYIRLLPVIFILLISISSQAQTQTKINKIDSLMMVAHQRGIFNGNILVAEKGEIIYQNELGYAGADKEQKLSPDMLFNIGSISKELDAVGIMKLAEDQKLDLSDPVSRFLEDLPSWSDKVTLGNLLQYTSGLPRIEYGKGQSFTDADAWEKLKTLDSLSFDPGSNYLYSNYNVFLRKRIIENISGLSYADFLQKEIFEPFGLIDTKVDPDSSLPNLARAFNNKFIQDPHERFLSGSIYMSAMDLYKWTRILHGGDVISKSSLLILFEGYENNNSVLGLGRIKNDSLLMHWNSGSSYNFESSQYYNPVDDFTVILMTNNKNFNVGDLTSAIDAILRNKPFNIPRKSLYMALRTEIYYEGFEAGIKLLSKIQKEQNEFYDSNTEKALEKTADYLLKNGRKEDGTRVMEYLNKVYPKAAEEKKVGE